MKIVTHTTFELFGQQIKVPVDYTPEHLNEGEKELPDHILRDMAQQLIANELETAVVSSRATVRAHY